MTDSELSSEVRKTWGNYLLRKSHALREHGLTRLSETLWLEADQLLNSPFRPLADHFMPTAEPEKAGGHH